MTFLSQFKQLDVYRKIPNDLSQATLSGGAISLIAIVLMSIFFFAEFLSYMRVETVKETLIDVPRGGEKMRINLNITLLDLPCHVISLDQQDAMGTHVMDVQGTLMKRRLTKDGVIISEEENTSGDHHHMDFSEETIQEMREAIKRGEQCQLHGHLLVNKVPGNFHVSCHAKGAVLHRIFDNIEGVDMSHRINHLSFGDQYTPSATVERLLKKHGESFVSFFPLDGQQKREVFSNVAPTYEYYIKLVPTTFEHSGEDIFHSYQFSSAQREFPSNRMLPAIFFRYELTPVTVTYKQQQKSFLHFIVQVCAIVGGIFTVAGIVAGIVQQSIAVVKKMK
eukprot:GILI01005909.1.p1 GENE.GILI01005909.1~~GILI01005909.1.p1  ORF type:complete len:336 (+),score=86.99 GILI01005909.1:52-1059(+)